ncbi:hypothetical protein V6Z11_D06G107800 [Gossypium hirsutum]
MKRADPSPGSGTKRRFAESSLPEAINLRFDSDDCGAKTKIWPPGARPAWRRICVEMTYAPGGDARAGFVAYSAETGVCAAASPE